MDSTEMTELYHSIAKQYLDGLNSGNMEVILALFDSEAEVHSPIYGIRKAQVFYQILSNDTAESITTLKQVIADPAQKSMAMWFHYQWKLANFHHVEFDCVDLIKFTQELKIRELRILYDTYPIRPFLD